MIGTEHLSTLILKSELEGIYGIIIWTLYVGHSIVTYNLESENKAIRCAADSVKTTLL